MDTKAGRATIIRVDLLPRSRQTVTLPQHDAQTIVPSADPAPARTIRRRSESGDIELISSASVFLDGR